MVGPGRRSDQGRVGCNDHRLREAAVIAQAVADRSQSPAARPQLETVVLPPTRKLRQRPQAQTPWTTTASPSQERSPPGRIDNGPGDLVAEGQRQGIVELDAEASMTWRSDRQTPPR